ncbi:MAG: glutamyl-tRNA reductase, partial [Thermoguttaceae bacterium]
TDLHRHRVSIPSVAIIDFAMQIFEQLHDKRIVLFGAGEMGEETLRFLRDQGVHQTTIVNRSKDRAEKLALDFGADVCEWSSRFESLIDADILISMTGASEPVLTLQNYRDIETKRKGCPLFILDLALPRDIDPQIGECSNVYLYSIDDLQEACEKNRKLRNREIPKAQLIITKSAERFVRDMNHRKGGEMIQQLRERWGHICEAELNRLFNKLSDLEPSKQEEIRRSFDRVLGKLLHPPLERLRDESKDGVPHKLLDALMRLFRL